MKVLVTGGAGYVGSIVAGGLLAGGHSVRVLDSLMYGGDALMGLYPAGDFEFIRGDIRDRDTVTRALAGTDAVIHLAAIVGDPACSRTPDVAKDVNEKGSLALFEAAARAKVKRFVFASTCSNYGKMGAAGDALTETSELRPVSLYAETKVAVERALLASTGGPVVTLLRLATVYGLSPRMRFDLTVNEFTMELMTKRELKIFGGQFWRPYLHVRDAARMMRLVLERPESAVGGEVFNVGSNSENYTKQMLVDLISAEVGGDLKIEHVHRAEDPRDYKVDFSKAKAFGFIPSRSVRDGVREIMSAITNGVITDFDNPKYRD
ncbi:MAG: NAD(P)-dependent oxidoreductase [Acidobacteria bacterium]|nr:MAG: NAD(P)-dependent oxidoreductase [Acidobacteriota bacterium]